MASDAPDVMLQLTPQPDSDATAELILTFENGDSVALADATKSDVAADTVNDVPAYSIFRWVDEGIVSYPACPSCSTSTTTTATPSSTARRASWWTVRPGPTTARTGDTACRLSTSKAEQAPASTTSVPSAPAASYLGDEIDETHQPDRLRLQRCSSPPSLNNP